MIVYFKEAGYGGDAWFMPAFFYSRKGIQNYSDPSFFVYSKTGLNLFKTGAGSYLRKYTAPYSC